MCLNISGDLRACGEWRDRCKDPGVREAGSQNSLGRDKSDEGGTCICVSECQETWELPQFRQVKDTPLGWKGLLE